MRPGNCMTVGGECAAGISDFLQHVLFPILTGTRCESTRYLSSLLLPHLSYITHLALPPPSPSLSLSLSLPACLPAYLNVCLSLSLSPSLSVCLSLSLSLLYIRTCKTCKVNDVENESHITIMFMQNTIIN